MCSACTGDYENPEPYFECQKCGNEMGYETDDGLCRDCSPRHFQPVMAEQESDDAS